MKHYDVRLSFEICRFFRFFLSDCSFVKFLLVFVLRKETWISLKDVCELCIVIISLLQRLKMVSYLVGH